MKYRRLGDAGMKVSAVSLGGWINYGKNKAAEEAARQVIERAYSLGINYYDLADVYERGDAELQMGAILKNFPRHTLVIASKAFWPMSDDVNDRGLSRKHLMESIDKSLKRLGTDYLDIYFCHRPDPETPLEETVRAMDDLIHQGKVLYWGTSEWEGQQIIEAYEICERLNLYKPKVEQPQYSMLYRERVEGSILPATAPRGIGLVVWSPLAMGMLTGKYDDGLPEDSRFVREPWAKDRFFNAANQERVRQLKAIADDLGITRAQLALAWALRHPSMSSVITGATRPDQVDENVVAATVTISEDQYEAIDRILAS
ncbi:MAG: aldo/keto reductase family protein [Roseiflexaceae bacterium]